jgi:NAD(P)-dependent dehydrogenase (short-subunit alcohol dehydrogenase family)
MAKIFAGLGNELGVHGISPVIGRAYTGTIEMTLQEVSMAAENTNNSITKIALVTGGSRGLGRNTALSLARKGVDVVITYHSNQAEADATVAAIKDLGCKAVALQLDTGTTKGFADFAARLKVALKDNWGAAQFDYLVNNAGIGITKPFAETTEAEFDRLMNVNLKGVYFLTQTLLPLIADGGRIVNLSSGLARFSLPGFSAYGAMKGAIEVLTHYLAKELGPRRIAVNTVAPGAIETDFGGGHVRDNAEANRQVANNTALGRAGLPDDIGPMIASLLSDDNRWINGQRIEATGGFAL